MSLNQLLQNKRKPWLNARVNNLVVDGSVTADIPVTLSGDVTGTGSGTIPTTIVNSGVSAGIYNNPRLSVNVKGLVTSAVTGPETIVRYAGGMAVVVNPTTNTILTPISLYGALTVPENTFSSNKTFSLTLRGNHIANPAVNTLFIGLAIGPVGSPVIQTGEVGIQNTELSSGSFQFAADLLAGTNNININGIGKYTNTSLNTYFGSITYSGPTNIPLEIVPYVRVQTSDPSTGLSGMFCSLTYATIL